MSFETVLDQAIQELDIDLLFFEGSEDFPTILEAIEELEWCITEGLELIKKKYSQEFDDKTVNWILAALQTALNRKLRRGTERQLEAEDVTTVIKHALLKKGHKDQNRVEALANDPHIVKNFMRELQERSESIVDKVKEMEGRKEEPRSRTPLAKRKIPLTQDPFGFK